MTVLPVEEIEDFWALECPIEASFLPDDEIERAIAQRRAKAAYSWSSMGTAETFWDPVDAGYDYRRHREDIVVVPPGQRVPEVTFDDRLDERNVTYWLWEPFWAEQETRVRAGLPKDRVAEFNAELADAKKAKDNAQRFEVLRKGVRIARGR